MTPRVSVIIPLYNGARWVDATLESLSAQTFRDFEALLVDDGSEDATVEVIQKHLKDPRFLLYKKPHSGIPATRNFALARARGELIAFLDQDDLWVPEKLAEQVARFDADPGLGAVYSPVRIVDDDDQFSTVHPAWWYWRGAEGRIFADALKHWTSIMVLSLLAKKSAIEAVGGFDESLFGFDDLDLVLRLAEKVPFGRIDRPLATWRWHAGSTTRKEAMYTDQFNVLSKFRRSWPEHGRLLDGHVAAAHQSYGHFLLKHGRGPEARREFGAALNGRPWDPALWVMCLVCRVLYH